MLLWGIWVVLPFTAFSSASFALMAKLGTEYMWGGFMLFGGITLVFGTITRNIDLIRSGAFLGFVIWLVLGILGTISDPTATGLAVRLTLALMHAYMYMQVKIHKELVTGEITIDDLREYCKTKNN